MVSNKHVELMVFNPSDTEGTYLSVPARAQTGLTIRLLQLYSVHYNLQIPVSFNKEHYSGKIIAKSYTFVAFRGSRGIVKLPPGKYTLHTDVDGTATATKELTVTTHDVELPTIVLHRSPLERHYGHGFPRIGELVNLSGRAYYLPAMSGHWTLLYFWQVSCPPCIEKGIPELIAFAKAHASEHKEFRIIAIHAHLSDDPINESEFRSRTLTFEKTIWHGAPQFPLVYDKSGQTTTDWGIQELGTFALIDPRGNLVRNGSLSMLGNKLTK